MDDLEPAQAKAAKVSASQLLSLKQLVSKGKASKLNVWSNRDWPNADDLFTVQYTSGSTGTPKGVMVTHAAYLARSSSVFRSDCSADRLPHLLALAEIARPYARGGVLFSYEPLSHSSRRNEQTGILHGCRIGFASGDMEKLFEEVQIIRPTGMAGVPRVWNKIYAEYQKALHLASLASPQAKKHQLERETLKKFRFILGDRIGGISCGGAPTSPAVVNFLKRCFRCTVMDSYGATETGGIAIDGKSDGQSNQLATVQTKLLDWQEYKSTDVPPRGELLVKSRSIAVGYYNNPADTCVRSMPSLFAG